MAIAAPSPIIFVLGGVEREFRLTNKAFLEIARRAANGSRNGHCDFLWFALTNKEGLTEDEFVEQLPLADFDLISSLVEAINLEWTGRNKSSDPRNEAFRPIRAAIPSTNGSGSLPSGA